MTIHRERRAKLWQEVDRLLGPEPPVPPVEIPIARRRRRSYQHSDADPRAAVELRRDDDDSLHWLYAPPPAAIGGRRRNWRASVSASDRVVSSFRFASLGPNELNERLLDLDARLTPEQGIKRWLPTASDPARGRLEPHDASERLAGPTLLFVHGTFSKGRMFFDELAATESGRQKLVSWSKTSRYRNILAFDHATLSVGAWSNGIDLAAALKNVRGPIDVVCHSRGGLVVSWALRLRPIPIRTLIFVGSPLTGTSLASPHRLRAALDRLASFADATAAGGVALATVLPFAAGAAGLAKICGSALRLGDTPIVDAAAMLVPGLASQQRIRNSETQKLFEDRWLTIPTMFGVGCNFQPAESDEPLWRFWRRFTNIGSQIKHAAADFVFEEENDLVVDLAAMQQLGESSGFGGSTVAMAMKEFKILGPLEGSRTTHHTNYFRNATVVAKIDSWLP